jgi:hypothetical protein
MVIIECTNFEDINKMIQVDITALTHLTHEIGLRMKKKKSGKILLLGSVAAFLPTPTYAAYAAAKSYVLSLGQSLNYELKDHGVSVTVLNPGATDTEFFDVSGQKMTFYQKLFMMQSMPVAKIGIKGLFRGKSSIVPGIINKLTAILNKIKPTKFEFTSSTQGNEKLNMQRARSKENKEIKKQEIKDKAIILFLEDAKELPSVSQIAKACDMSKGALYTYFSSKEEVFLDILTDEYITWFKYCKEAVLNTSDFKLLLDKTF